MTRVAVIILRILLAQREPIIPLRVQGHGIVDDGGQRINITRQGGSNEQVVGMKIGHGGEGVMCRARGGLGKRLVVGGFDWHTRAGSL